MSLQNGQNYPMRSSVHCFRNPHNGDIPETLYYLSTLEQAPCWYAYRYLARLTGELAKMEA